MFCHAIDATANVIACRTKHSVTCEMDQETKYRMKNEAKKKQHQLKANSQQPDCECIECRFTLDFQVPCVCLAVCVGGLMHGA